MKRKTNLTKKLLVTCIGTLLTSASVAGSLDLQSNQDTMTPRSSVNTGNASSIANATDVLDLVFLIDSSESMEPMAKSVSAAMDKLAKGLSCQSPIFVKNRFIGIGDESGNYFSGTVFDESLSTALPGVSLATDQYEDNAPAVSDIIKNYKFMTPQSGKDYFKAIITIGDEGTENGAPVRQSDYDAAYKANQDAINGKVYLFSMPVSTRLGTSMSVLTPLYKAMSEGSNGATVQGHVFGDTGGVMRPLDESSNMEEEIEKIICSFTTPTPTPTPTPAKPVPSLSILGMLSLLATLGFAAFRRKR